MVPSRLTRRTVLTGLAGIATLALAACGGSATVATSASSAGSSAPTSASSALTSAASVSTSAAASTTAATTASSASAMTSTASASAASSSAGSATASTSGPASSASTATASGAASGTPITIGAVFTTTKDNAAYGISQTNALKLGLDDLNQAGGINGAPLAVNFQDDAGDAKQALTVFQTLIQTNKVPAIIGPTLSSSAVAADPLAQQAKVAVLGISNTAGGVTTIGDFIFRDSLSEEQVVPTTVKVSIDKLGIKSAAIIWGNDNAFTKSGYQVMKDALTKNGVKIVTEETFAQGDVDFSAQLTKIKGLNPDAIFASALLPEATHIVDTARNKLQIPDSVHIIGGNGFNSPALIKNLGNAAEGVVVGAAWNIASPNEKSQAFVKAYQAKYKSDPDQFGAQAYAGLTIMADAIKRAGANPTGDAIRQALTQTNIETVLGKFSFTPSRDANQTPVVQIIKDGKFALLS